MGRVTNSIGSSGHYLESGIEDGVQSTPDDLEKVGNQKKENVEVFESETSDITHASSIGEKDLV